MTYFTDLRLVFQAIADRQREFDWLITDLTCGRLEVRDGRPEPLPNIGPYWFSGDELTYLVSEYELQFDWGVLSGFPRGTSIQLNPLEVVPYADGNGTLWVAEPKIQHPLAEVEIVCWDATCMLLLCKDDSIGRSFRSFFPEAVDLAEYNKARQIRPPS